MNLLSRSCNISNIFFVIMEILSNTGHAKILRTFLGERRTNDYLITIRRRILYLYTQSPIAHVLVHIAINI